MKHKTLLTFNPTNFVAPNVLWGSATSFPVILKDSSFGNILLAGQRIHFTGGGVVNVADVVTHSNGKATGHGVAPNAISSTGGWTYQGHFAGTGLYTSADTAEQKYNTLPHTTRLILAVDPTTVQNGGTYIVHGNLTDVNRIQE